LPPKIVTGMIVANITNSNNLRDKKKY